MNPVAFYTAAFVTVFAVVFMILQTNPVSSAILLVASFFGLAVIYVGLGAHFVAALQILVYAGAIMVLFIFVIMLLNLQGDELVRDKPNAKRLSAALVGLALFAFLARHVFKIPRVEFMETQAAFGTVRDVAKLMLTEYVVPFELLGVLLLVGLVGAIVLGKKEDA